MPRSRQSSLLGIPMITQSEPVRQALTALGIRPLIPSEFPSHWPAWPAEELRPQNAKRKAKDEEEEEEEEEAEEEEEETDAQKGKKKDAGAEEEEDLGE